MTAAGGDWGFVADERSLGYKMIDILDGGGGDVTVKSRDSSVQAFSAILSATSEPLKRMLGEKFREAHDKTISFENYGCDAVKFFIYYIHGDIKKCPLSFTETFDLLELSEMYGLKKYVVYLIEFIVRDTNKENAINILCLCDQYVRLSEESKMNIRRVAKQILFENMGSVMKLYFEFKEVCDGLENLEEDFENVTPEETVAMSEKIMKQYCVDSVTVPLTKYNAIPLGYKTDGKIFKMYPQIKKLFMWVNETDHYIKKSHIFDLKSTNEYIVIKTTLNELEFVFIKD
ncbi:MAG: hypothetical protein Harvfovirus36_5 [Harvfovirus sp.]|uniref:BTB domain-containing protein n=1 Tax=Harvfovirus sp. TaxID=2487768 RepID=A0A3G5A4Q8_9VIRU|nr:MAG: hypothetical protein Harvfovirus36_5 [Harvfovirus sp.]